MDEFCDVPIVASDHGIHLISRSKKIFKSRLTRSNQLFVTIAKQEKRFYE